MRDKISLEEVPTKVNIDAQPESKKLSLDMFFRFVDYVNERIAWVSAVALVSMMLLIVFNVLKRTISVPLLGVTEIVSWLSALTAILSLGYAQIYKSHVFIDLLVERFSFIIRRVTHTVMNIASIVFFAIASWQINFYAISLMKSNTVSETLLIPFYPLIFISSIGFICLILALIKETLTIWRREKGE
ncbi:MAG TPA: TRAP transporter small permease [Pseudogracilibacillus sp.]|nr:TRAP transporter small permease [Pseudogracilibacillus sp.]